MNKMRCPHCKKELTPVKGKQAGTQYSTPLRCVLFNAPLRGKSTLVVFLSSQFSKYFPFSCFLLQKPKSKVLNLHRNPIPTVDIIIAIGDKIVLIKRKNPPLGWALPGGFVDYGESFEDAALREAKEETGLDVMALVQFHTYSNPDRDSRCHTASTVFTGKAKGLPQAGDDAAKAELFGKDTLPLLAFDHAKILADYFASLKF